MLSGRRQRHLSWAWSAKAKKLSDQAWRLYVQRREEERAQLAQAAKAAAERGGVAREVWGEAHPVQGRAIRDEARR